MFSFVELSTEPVFGDPTFRILDENLRPWWPFRSEGGFIWGSRSGDLIHFIGSVPLSGEPGSGGYLAYTVELKGESLELDGTISFTYSDPCFDCLDLLGHTDVRATLVPEPSAALLFALTIIAGINQRRSQ